MKIYCILFDTAPLHDMFVEFAKKNDANLSCQISNSHTASSVLSMLTGETPSDLENNDFNIHKSWFRNGDKVYSKKFPWNNKTITEKLINKGWKVNFHNSHTIIKDVCSNEEYTRTTAYPGGLKKEEELWWNSKLIVETTLGNSKKTEGFYDDEKKYIKKVQEQREGNEFHFILYHQHHIAEQIGGKYDESYNRLNLLLNHWDLSEPNSFFYIFADHGLYSKIDRYQSPPYSWYTWSITKDNITNRIPRHINSIMDFSPTISDIIGSDGFYENSTSIYDIIDENRIYLIEDSRFSVSDMKTTNFAAVKVISWQGKQPVEFLQLVYHKPENKYKVFLYNTADKRINVCSQYKGFVSELNSLPPEHLDIKNKLENRLKEKGILI